MEMYLLVSFLINKGIRDLEILITGLEFTTNQMCETIQNSTLNTYQIFEVK